jgi:hypothetical protein
MNHGGSMENVLVDQKIRIRARKVGVNAHVVRLIAATGFCLIVWLVGGNRLLSMVLFSAMFGLSQLFGMYFIVNWPGLTWPSAQFKQVMIKVLAFSILVMSVVLCWSLWTDL